MEVDVSFDNITITAHIKPNKMYHLKKLIEHDVAIVLERTLTDRFRAYTKDNGRVVLLLDYDKIKGQAFNARPFRLEFNPNKLRDEDKNILNKIITYLEDIAISRCDLAFDLYGIDCSEFVFEKKGKSVASKIFYSSTGKLETKYLGASRSEKQARLYNKKVEQLAHGSEIEKKEAMTHAEWWRLEFQLRNRAVDDVFHVLDEVVFKQNDFSGLGIEGQIYLDIMQNNKSLWKKVHRNTRSKYKKLLNEFKTSETDYQQILKDLLAEKRPRLEAQLNYYIGQGVG